MSTKRIGIALFATTLIIIARKWSDWKRRVLTTIAFRAGQRFVNRYPNIALDIAYGDQPWQKLDVYWPLEGERLPVIVFAHGGSWLGGDKNLYPLIGERYIAQGCVVVIINYGHYPDVTFPKFVEDAAAAVAWSISHIENYHGDPDAIFMAGHSAGAHICSLVMLDDRYLAAHGLTRNDLRGLIAISAPTDLSTLLQHLSERPSVGSHDTLMKIMGGAEQLPDADPIRHARPDTPPILLIHGDRDQVVPVSIARNFASALRAAGAPVNYIEYEGATHISMFLEGVMQKRDQPLRLMVDSIDFVQRVLNASRVESTLVDTAA